MPQSSILYSTLRVSVLEKQLITSEDMRKLAEAPDEAAAMRMLGEHGYAVQAAQDESADPLEAAIAEAVAGAKALITELTPNTRYTDAFLLRSDMSNLKLLIKRRFLGSDSTDGFDKTALIQLPVLAAMVKTWSFFDLPQPILDELEKWCEMAENADKRIDFDPARLSCGLDRAYYEYVRAIDEPFIREYFAEECDFVNFSAFYRVRARGGDARLLRDYLMPEGYLTHERIIAAFDAENAEAAQRDMIAGVNNMGLHKALRQAIERIAAGESPAYIEFVRDNRLMALARECKSQLETVRPVLAYYIARMREVRCVRMVITLKRNGFEPAFIKERLRDLYV